MEFLLMTIRIDNRTQNKSLSICHYGKINALLCALTLLFSKIYVNFTKSAKRFKKKIQPSEMNN